MGKLSDQQIVQAKPRDKKYSLLDGEGLQVDVHPSGGKYWIHRYTFEGKRVPINIGVYPTIKLKQARLIASNNRLMVSKGINPKQIKEDQKIVRKVEVATTFKYVCDKFIEEVYKPNTKEQTWKKIVPYFPKDLYPYLGKKPIKEIKALELYEVCKKISDRGSREQAIRIMRKISDIFQWAVRLNFIDSNIAYGLAKSLPKHTKTNYKAKTTPKEYGEVLRKVYNYDGNSFIVNTCLKLLPLVVTRQSELRSMKWKDVNLEEQVWEFTVSKTNTKHLVPLSTQALKLINKLFPITGSGEYVFSSDVDTKNKYISDSIVRKYLRLSGVAQDDSALHGFRTSFRTLGEEQLGLNPYALEIQISHKHPMDKHGGAYARAEFNKQRKEIMQKWADYCDELMSGVHG